MDPSHIQDKQPGAGSALDTHLTMMLCLLKHSSRGPFACKTSSNIAWSREEELCLAEVVVTHPSGVDQGDHHPPWAIRISSPACNHEQLSPQTNSLERWQRTIEAQGLLLELARAPFHITSWQAQPKRSRSVCTECLESGVAASRRKCHLDKHL